MEQQKEKNLIVSNIGVHDVEVFDREGTVPKYGTAYILKEDYGDDDVFYFYRGVMKDSSTEPGIYSTGDGFFELIEPKEEERAEYNIKSHLANMKPGDMIAILKDKKNIKHVHYENSKLFVPAVSAKDNILKRALKEAFNAKEVTIEDCKSGFSDRNAFFNFSSVMRSEEGSISFLLMDRGCNALNLGYAIILYERDPENPIGKSLNNPEVIEELRAIVGKIKNPIVMTSDSDDSSVIDLDGKIVVSSEDSFDV